MKNTMSKSFNFQTYLVENSRVIYKFNKKITFVEKIKIFTKTNKIEH